MRATIAPFSPVFLVLTTVQATACVTLPLANAPATRTLWESTAPFKFANVPTIVLAMASVIS